MKPMNYKQAWEHIFENNLTDAERAEILAAPDSRASMNLGYAATRLSEASEAANGKGAGAEMQLFERLLDENPL